MLLGKKNNHPFQKHKRLHDGWKLVTDGEKHSLMEALAQQIHICDPLCEIQAKVSKSEI